MTGQPGGSGQDPQPAADPPKPGRIPPGPMQTDPGPGPDWLRALVRSTARPRP
jgi:hypothetical protein